MAGYLGRGSLLWLTRFSLTKGRFLLDFSSDFFVSLFAGSFGGVGD